MRNTVLVLIISTLLTSCSLAPTYHRPEMFIPEEYKEMGEWMPANPEVAEIDRGKWWEIYDDPELNALQEQVTSANQDLKAALARYDEAKAVAAQARSYLFPTIDAITIPTRQKASAHVANPSTVRLYNDVLVGADLSYELDVWGRVRNAARSASDLAKASAADLAFVDLSVHAELASDYFSLRGAEQAQRALDATVIAYEKALVLNRNLFKGGAAPAEVLYQSQTQLETAKTLATDMLLKRAQLEHAIAVLVGEVPAAFSLPVSNKPVPFIAVKPNLPSTLLERRPDIAAAELRVQAANANIGVTRAAYFPAFNLSSSLAVESKKLANLFTHPSLVWSLGPAVGPAALGTINAGPPISQILIDGGLIRALNAQAWATYSETVADYRQTVLQAYQEVEDNLVALHRLDQENQTQTAATVSANNAVEQARDRYKGGLTTYLDVVINQTTALQVELSAIDIRTRYHVASVQLVKALGGGW